ncbi:hypothetical protein [Paenibacillus cremeus]|uniref:Hydrolase n=1 Tax=Paenibacillus cremeus TaxID=2163881 RepID=A0A559KE48_9BACL|nr:hypothetical protein [Paenibacillus cremeus]TVY10379.1 hypothetical protein FPZ49_08240 [Paenibacillus cremeus]
METKRRYYVSVQSRTIMENQGDAAYELEIDATPEQIDRLRDLFDEKEDYEQDSFIRAHAPGIPYHHDAPNDGYDASLQTIYETLHDLGTKETKDHIESMQVLNRNW